MTSKTRNWVRIIGITGAALVIAGGITLGSLKVAEATGYVTLPTRAARMHGYGTHGRGSGMNDHGYMHGGRKSRQHRDGQMGGQGMKGGRRSNGMAYGFSGQTQSGDAYILQHVLMMLQSEQRIATELGTNDSVAQTIAVTRAAEITAVTALQTQWYPDAGAVTVPSTYNMLSINELRQTMLQHSQLLEQINAGASYEHPELASWVQATLAKRATEITTLYTK